MTFALGAHLPQPLHQQGSSLPHYFLETHFHVKDFSGEKATFSSTPCLLCA